MVPYYAHPICNTGKIKIPDNHKMVDEQVCIFYPKPQQSKTIRKSKTHCTRRGLEPQGLTKILCCGAAQRTLKPCNIKNSMKNL